MPPLQDLTGMRFGRLTVLHRAPTVHKRTMWYCRCDCGSELIVGAGNLKAARTESCGCLQSERTSVANKTHGMHGTRLYRIWGCMHNRCHRKSYHAFKHYGGRGIKLCPEWDDHFEPFMEWALANGYGDDLTIDRIDSDGNYEPANCRWATMKEQNMNKRIKNGLKITEG